ncbi:MAG: mRNA cap guanine-N7 methyltransferase [Phylliscum demangeonii]|nr:MAG: mRNA cap guanine-N7 methyltransferase [Phylliscum demangeonii]
MYDPARDVFTASDDTDPHLDEAEDDHSPGQRESTISPVPKTLDGKEVKETLKAVAAEKSSDVAQPKEFMVLNNPPGQAAAAQEVDLAPASVMALKKLPAQASSSAALEVNQAPISDLKAVPEKSKKRSRSPSPTKDKRQSSPLTQIASDMGKAESEGLDSRVEKSDPRLVKKRKTDASATKSDPQQSRVPMTATNLPRFSRKKDDTVAAQKSRPPRVPDDEPPRRDGPPSSLSRKRMRIPETRTRRDDRSDNHYDQRRRTRSPERRRRSPTPPARSPPRKHKRPGGAARFSAAEKEALRQRQLDREEAEAQAAQAEAARRGAKDVVREHYNSVPQRGRDWRKTDSRIRGLRSFNNWVKSCIIQKFSPNEDHLPGATKTARWAEGAAGGGGRGTDAAPKGLKILDIGCGKGGDLGKWQQAPQPVELYVGVDPADVSIEQAKDRYREMSDRNRGRGPPGAGQPRRFRAEFFVKDAFDEWLGDIPFIREVGIDGKVGPDHGGGNSRWGGGGFDVVSMMFCMHYAFESEAKVRGMLRNVAGSLKKGGRLLGVIPDSDVISAKVSEYHKRRATASNGQPHESADNAPKDEPTKPTDPNEDEPAKPTDPGKVEPAKPAAPKEDETPLEWGNSIYRVRFPPGKTPEDGVFRPPWGWKYHYFMEEAVEGVPEYVVPWEAFRALTEDYNLELQYKRSFLDVWKEEKEDGILGPLSERMGVRERGRGSLLVREEELEAAGFYVAFCFYKV